MNGRRRRHWRKYSLPYRIIISPVEDAVAASVEILVAEETPETVIKQESDDESAGVDESTGVAERPEDGEPADEETKPTEELSELDDETEGIGNSA